MTQRTLYKTIERIARKEFATEEQLIIAVLDEIVRNEQIDIIGGRIWKLLVPERSYMLMHELGKIDRIGLRYTIPIKKYPIFGQVAKVRTVLANETNRALRNKGIVKYSATGIGEQTPIGKTSYYEFIMAFNSPVLRDSLVYTMNIISQAVTNLLASRKSEAKSRKLQSDLDEAWELQKRLLPDHEYQFGPYELYGISIPERVVGGDFFNYLQLNTDQDRLGIAVGDAASKGFSAAVQALFVSGALMMSIESESSISSTLRRINSINRRIFPDDRFLTLFYCELFREHQGLCLYSNAGHASPIFFEAATGNCRYLDVNGPVLGLMDNPSFSLSTIHFAPGDVLLVYTDGITEANNGIDEFGEERLESLLKKNALHPSKRIAEAILEEVQKFSALGEYPDDKTIVVMKMKG